MRYSPPRFRFAVLPLAAAAMFVSVIFARGHHVLAASEEAADIPSARIHEKVIAEASRGSDIVAWRVTGTGTGRHVAWIEKDKGRTVWLDGKAIGGPYDEVKYFYFEAVDEKPVLTFVARRKSTWILKVGAQEYGGFTKVTATDVGADGTVVAGVCHDTACRLLLNGQETGPQFEDIGTPDFSPKGTHLAYFGKRQGKWVALVEGRETGPEMDDWWRHRWSPDEQLVVAAELDGKFTWIVGEAAGPRFDVIGDIAFSHDGQHVAYGGANAGSGFAKKEVRGFIVVDGQALEQSYEGGSMLGNWSWLGGASQSIAKGVRTLSPQFHGVSNPDFLQNGELVFAHSRPDGQIVVSLGDREGPPFDDLASPIVVSRDGAHVVYVARDEGDEGEEDEFVEVHDQTPGLRFPAQNRDVAMVTWIGVTDEGRLVYATALGGKQFRSGASDRAFRHVVIDGVHEAEYDALGISRCLFSRDGEQHAYIVIGAKGTRDRLLLNGRQTGLYDDIRNVHFVPHGVEFVARQDRRLLEVTVDRR